MARFTVCIFSLSAYETKTLLLKNINFYRKMPTTIQSFFFILMYEKLKQYGVNNVINGSEKNEFNSEIKVTRKNAPPPSRQ